MKRTDTLTKIVSLLLFGVLAAYLGVYLISSASKDLRTAPAVYVTLTDSATASGIIVRDETLVRSSKSYLSIVAKNGRLLSAGETIAVSYNSEDAMARAGKIRELELQKQYIVSVLNGRSSEESISEKDVSIKSSITALAAAAAMHRTDELSDACLNLGALVLENTEIKTTQVDLDLVSQEISKLRQNSVYDTVAITAESVGLFSSGADGFENLKPSDLQNLTTESLRQLSETPQALPEDLIGKTVSSYEWYFAASISEEYAERFELNKSEKLDFGRYCPQPVKGLLIGKSGISDGQCVLVFRCTSSIAELLSVRKTTADIVLDTREGIRIPKDAVSSDENGTFVYTVTGLQAEKKYVDIAWETDDYYLAAAHGEKSSLRVGNEIILSTKNIYDGKLLD